MLRRVGGTSAMLRRPLARQPVHAHVRELHPGVPLLLKAATVIRNVKLGTTWLSLILRRPTIADLKLTANSTETIGGLWTRWMFRIAALSGGGLAVGSAVVFVTSRETITVSGRSRLLLSTWEEEIVLGNGASAQLTQAFSSDLICETGDDELLAADEPDGVLSRVAHALRHAWHLGDLTIGHVIWSVMYGLVVLGGGQGAMYFLLSGFTSREEYIKRRRRHWLRTPTGQRWWLRSAEGRRVVRAARRVVRAAVESSDLPEGVQSPEWKAVSYGA